MTSEEMLLHFDDRYIKTRTPSDMEQAKKLRRRGMLELIRTSSRNGQIEYYQWRLTAKGARARNEILRARNIEASLTKAQIELLREFKRGTAYVTLPMRRELDNRVAIMWQLNARSLVRAIRTTKDNGHAATIWDINAAGLAALHFHTQEAAA